MNKTTSAQDVFWENPSTGKTQQNSSREDLYYEALYNHEPRLQLANLVKRSWLGKTPSSDLQRQT